MIQINFEDITIDSLTANNQETLAIVKEDEIFYIKIFLKGYSNKVVVFSNGALDPEKKKPPVFMRESWIDDFDFNAIFIDDRTIHGKELKIGWGVGTPERHFLVDYSEIIKKVINELNFKNENIFYYGSSAGGFMSMGLSSMHDKSTAIVNNPQTYVYNYFESYVNDLVEKVFIDKNKNEVFKECAERFSITALFKKYKRVPNVHYIQNRLCKSDMRNQYLPFLKIVDKYNVDATPINFILYNNYKSGHNPLGKDDTLKIINSIINKDNIILN